MRTSINKIVKFKLEGCSYIGQVINEYFKPGPIKYLDVKLNNGTVLTNIIDSTVDYGD